MKEFYHEDKDTLRMALHGITCLSLVEEHEIQIDKIKKDLPHDIKLIRNKPKRNENFNCFEFAFGLNDYHEYVTLRAKDQTGNSFINSFFIEWLIDKKYLHVGNKIIIYLQKNKVKHAGILDYRIVTSKWGAGGNLYTHSIWEVPYE